MLGDTENLFSERTRLLIVDDSRMVRASLRKHLSDTYDLIEEADGEAGWARLLADDSIRLVISDVSMPKLDGHALLQRIRAYDDQRISHVPVIIISGDDEPGAKQHAVSIGASDFITKSTDQAELLVRVKTNLEKREIESKLVVANKAIAEEATTDPVTGLFTINYLRKQGEKFVSFGNRHNTSVSCLSIALDRFDELSQRYPDAVCNKVLQLLGKMFAGKLRGEDLVAHVSGALFIVALPSAVTNQALVAADRMCQATSAAKIGYKGDTIALSCSIGVVSTEQFPNLSFEELISAANQRRQYAQDQGGNWVEAAAEVATASANGQTESAVGESVESSYQSIDQILDWLNSDQTDRVLDRLPQAIERLVPLLELANGLYGLGMDVGQIQAKAKSMQ
ncbi:diguanylate cyclase [Leeia sp. TBRC 13508]|uniref:Diguanylate cyclase n=1 Tax=Leeia speluncae TaxID=2884804 RepID=A0ABS8D2P4_9NEIS|nr:diguanylate cyclase [Leeia speluncae]MCB6182474.1 diguanylate cyclase [Leeia speluncae]